MKTIKATYETRHITVMTSSNCNSLHCGASTSNATGRCLSKKIVW